jgi:hypothetical protein
VAYFALPDQVVEGCQGSFDGRAGHQTVDLVQVNHFHTQPFQAGLAGLLNLLDCLLRTKEVFGGNHNFISPGVLFQPAPGNFLAPAIRITVGGIEEGDA